MWRWSLGKSIGRGFVESASLISRPNYVSTNPLCYFIRFNSSSIHHHEDQYDVGGSLSNLGMTISNSSWKDLKKQNIKCQQVSKGDVIDFRNFLFTQYRDYLITNDGTQVKAEQLAGKVII
ncbi:hypothetical protein POM88_045964 [Heracleum sosnowskyi]|uniref:Uncharacterized protein n=1 Tax=Heracleum sosnowskyi TaxID=360622 RepID=A0AAD8H5S9_9APIA|nr:hypothetical protein POM88_045938 [Heracleum sosnowskyi]KAK1361468.1 hypothetical protein POM88_045942 [Heracleum sosnowskyi]KAK1361472.1 hypothetical protein POM88_045946 [Heracleum sosnowskyi]KAK1361477.1 hypothetical protein POM88_045951 [Heracleum sosnowskyi]KAK1361482.1 hypothetical protein POM88_045956 [Heracleum sosnowskyi]